MKLKDYIELLQKLQAEHGEDIDVETLGFTFEREPVRPPVIKHKLILSGRAKKDRFFTENIDEEQYRGEKVVRV